MATRFFSMGSYPPSASPWGWADAIARPWLRRADAICTPFLRRVQAKLTPCLCHSDAVI